ncbi:MAG: hypothetical protein LBV79_00815 [Candidatus Adiutrix sp.]|jgi:hypothetical protein|nr:hypothetical protein [Candidatus Adiutrix sp.]
MPHDLEHTYLLQPGLWELTGVYRDVNDRAFPQKGQLVVTHEPGLWLIEGQLTVVTEQTQTIASRYDVQPMPAGGSFTEWKSEVGGPEPVFGLFVIVDDAIMSPWQSRSGTYWGQEVLRRVSATEYQGRGFAFLNNEKVSAWATRLIFNG